MKKARLCTAVAAAAIPLIFLSAGTAFANARATAQYAGGQNMARVLIQNAEPDETCSFNVDGFSEAQGRVNGYGTLALYSGYLSAGQHTVQAQCDDEGFGAYTVTVTGTGSGNGGPTNLSGGQFPLLDDPIGGAIKVWQALVY
ncbi:hypothetical protein [Rhodococcus sp. NPDC127528]|uniref:hypothetical protein n=1 Tax=unclassified Rhodococcus (in: high G+C Gram-positive bacteria) TaxID=192944 RepID=UPI00363BC0F2